MGKKRKGITVDYINGARSDSVFGMKRYQDEIHREMEAVRLNRIEYSPSGSRLQNAVKVAAYPFKVALSLSPGAIRHVTMQHFAYLLFLPGMGRSVVTVYDTIMDERYSDFSLPARLMTRLNSLALRRAPVVITISDHSARSIMKIHGVRKEKIRVIKPGIDRSSFRPRPRVQSAFGIGGSPVVLALGSEEPRQNMDKVLLAFRKLLDKFPGAVLVKAGKPQWRGGRERLVSLSRRLGLEGKVIFLGYVPEKDLPLLYSCADVFVYPCASAGWGLPPVEAMACGVPVVVSNAGPLVEAVGDAGIMVSPESAGEIADAMLRILSDRKLARRLSAAGRKRTRLFSWRSAARKTRKVYEEMAAMPA